LCGAQNKLDAPRNGVYLRIVRCTDRSGDQARTMMSDGKPRRPARESGRSGIARGEAVPHQTAPIIAPEPDFGAAAEAAAAVSPPTIVREPAPRKTASAPSAVAPAADDAWAAFSEMQVALARGFAEIAVEMTGITQSGIAAATDAATAMLGVRTLAEAVEINAGLIRHRADAMIEGSVRLSEIGVKAVSEASRPLLARLGATWSAAGQV
jgi:hypothetical protein